MSDTGRVWRKSTYSSEQGECVEVAHSESALIPVRDSKDISRGVLTVPITSWAAMTAGLSRQ
ncbi:DUF397 domain-containing protein [Yinghuangia seranimata]|uniref:DUF397 domain-containing protein n=1 Tax=Yinghuangia seranimata TaxID=408067 RepID=UPI00248CCB1B|nr:DUF397 domain-containing protein [Yinghuangia seranimata]MDI2132298.1 DUF397 domain-containing protein [Yinghuangia seranimata]